jgi:nucleoside transporter
VNTFKMPRLFTMMFLQYFIYGSWYATAGLAMTKYGLSSIIGLTYSMVAVASIISPIVLGVVADRFVSSEKVIGTLHLIGGVLLYFIPAQMESGHQGVFLGILFIYMLVLTPSFALTNNVAFQHIKDPAKHFPIVRVFGTIGWIVAGVGIGQLGLSDSTLIFTIAAVASFIHGIYSMTLPQTPAPGKGKPFTKRDVLRIDAFKMMKDHQFLIFMVCSLLLYIPMSAYYSFTSPFLGSIGYHHVGTVMSIGQALEVFFMLMIPFFFKRLGIKWMLLIGMLAWVVRFIFFAIGGLSNISVLIIIGIAIHGICINFFIIPGTIYVERVADHNIKAQAQSLFVLFTQGIGSFIGSLLSGFIYNSTVLSNNRWFLFWLIPAITAAMIAVFFLLTFQVKKKEIKKYNDSEEKVHDTFRKS